MEALEKALQREGQKLGPDIFNQVEVKTLADIQRILTEFDPAKNKPHNDIPISTILNEVEGGKNVAYNVSASTKSKSKRDMLVEGMALIQRRLETSEEIANATEEIEINGRYVKPAILRSNTQGHAWVDPLIKQWTGGRRDGTLIVWDLDDGYQYRYEIFTHKLTRINKQ